MTNSYARPRRSVLFMPASNERAVAKAARLDVDSIILDLEDSVLPSHKADARESMSLGVAAHDFGNREVLVRINGLDTQWWRADLAAALASKAHGVVLPKIETPQQVVDVVQQMQAATTQSGANSIKPLWAMLETPAGVLSARAISQSSDKLTALLMGTADLGKELGLPERADRLGLIHALSQAVLVAKEAGLSVVDGVYMDIRDSEGLRNECEQGKALGFDGKSLIHPSQLAAANEVFAPSAAELQKARQLLAAWQKSAAKGEGICVVDNRLVEHLHVKRAEQLVALAEAIALRVAASSTS